MRQIGKKGKQWQKDRKELIKGLKEKGIYKIEGNDVFGPCGICGLWKKLDPDHKKKRSQGGSNKEENIQWICRSCHDLADNGGDPMNKKIKKKKASWQSEHKCKNCKVKSRMLICPNCGKISV